MSYNPANLISEELNIPLKQVFSTLSLLEEGNTIPFIARYRKEKTGSLDEIQVRDIKERSDYLTELNERKKTILSSIESQGKLTEELRKSIDGCMVKTLLEDLYMPYKPKRRTKATIAKEKGLEPLAERILAQPEKGSPEKEAEAFLNEEKGVKTIAEALEGARHIVAEAISENAEVRALIRETFQEEGLLTSTVRSQFKGKPTKFEQYYNFSEPVHKIPSHRFLAIRRGEDEEVLSMDIEVDEEPILEGIGALLTLNEKSPFYEQLTLAIKDSFLRLLSPSVESDVYIDLKMRSDSDAVEIFAENLRNLLLSAPLGGKAVIGIDPGLRTGCKCAALNDTGKYLDHTTIYLTKGSSSLLQAKSDFINFVEKFNPIAIAIGNGTGNRETESFVKETLKSINRQEIIVIQVSESGASVYSASEIAREEFSHLDLTIRGAISIARRLQDPLAELVKVEPKALGVGQYQHDVYQPMLERKLNDVVESCVNHVGVDLNTASAPLLSYIAGIGPALSKKIVSYRDSHDRFKTRKELLDVPGLGARAFEQAAGFLRILGGDNPLDASAVHPECYSTVTDMAKDLDISLNSLVGNLKEINKIDMSRYTKEGLGKETLEDIIGELKKPGRDPRKSFEMPTFRDDVTKPEDLTKGMVIEGIVTNVTAFGAFIDIGVHQDGLVHISQLSDKFIKEASEVVKTGDKLKVEVLDVDLNLKRISLTAKIGNGSAPEGKTKKSKTAKKPKPQKKQEKFSHNPFAGIF